LKPTETIRGGFTNHFHIDAGIAPANAIEIHPTKSNAFPRKAAESINSDYRINENIFPPRRHH
jgi:hypothetical protein